MTRIAYGLIALALLASPAFAQQQPVAAPSSPETQVVYQRLGQEIDRGLKLEIAATQLQGQVQKLTADLAKANAELAALKKEKAAPEDAASTSPDKTAVTPSPAQPGPIRKK